MMILLVRLICVALVILFITEIIYPLLTNTPIFNTFRKTVKDSPIETAYIPEPTVVDASLEDISKDIDIIASKYEEISKVSKKVKISAKAKAQAAKDIQDKADNLPI